MSITITLMTRSSIAHHNESNHTHYQEKCNNAANNSANQSGGSSGACVSRIDPNPVVVVFDELSPLIVAIVFDIVSPVCPEFASSVCIVPIVVGKVKGGDVDVDVERHV